MQAIGELADAANHHPDVDVRFGGVTVRLSTHEVEGLSDRDISNSQRGGPAFWFQQMDAPRPQRNRIHIDLYLPRDQVQARIAAALAAGGSLVSDANAPEWWTLADPEGNEVDLAIWG